MSLEEDVCSTLRSAQGVNFMCCGVRVYGKGYQKLATAIENNHIMVQQNINLGRGGASGRYYHSYGPNKVNLLQVAYNRIITLSQKSLVIHEMTHALQDYHHATLNTIDAECAAYIASASYSKIFSPNHNIYSNALLRKSTQSALIFACHNRFQSAC